MHAVCRGSRPFDRRLEPGWGLYTVSFAPALHSSLGPHSKGPCGTLADESFSPRQTDGELLVLMCLRHGTAEEGRQLGGEPAIRFAQLLELSGIPVGQVDQVVPTDYFNGLVASAASLCPRGTWLTFGIAYGSSSRLRTASSARTFPRWRMSGTARTN